ncbi:hypothetical protein OROGR_026853 [Orobanche gracilis]
MSGGSVSQRNEKTSVRHRSNPFEVAFTEHANFDTKDITSSRNGRHNLRNSVPYSSEMLSTADLISAVGYAWNRAKKPLSTLVSKSESTCKSVLVQGDAVLNYSDDEETLRPSNLAVDQPCSCNLNSKWSSSRLAQEDLKVKQKLACPRTSYELFYFWKTILTRSIMIEESYSISSTLVPSNLGSIYRWMAEIVPTKKMNQVVSVKIKSKRASNWVASEFLMNSGTVSVPTDTTSTFNRLTARTLDLSLGKDFMESNMTCSENNIVHGQHIDETDFNNLASASNNSENSMIESRDGPYEHQNDQGIVTFDEVDSSEVEISFSEKEISPYALAKQEHAFAGAMAGAFVSLCLHPIDTVKTVIQSCRVDRKPLHDMGRSIFTERGITGLYRGISSNIVASAPISAVYTFTYESVKKSLLPLFPKEYHSLAHCTSGGCASIATSFIFTPSERIKQQMQVCSHYRNCWSAFIEVVQKGGVLSLYAGWGAVLCRNVPHSVIKFYTYESLKQIMLPSTKSNAQSNLVAVDSRGTVDTLSWGWGTPLCFKFVDFVKEFRGRACKLEKCLRKFSIRTLTFLICGGLAGSMASLFTTPFDVVKTRLQTQIPGSMTPYGGVFNTLRDIGKQEGLKGLYSGVDSKTSDVYDSGSTFLFFL